jgi:hypothetical protein
MRQWLSIGPRSTKSRETGDRASGANASAANRLEPQRRFERIICTRQETFAATSRRAWTRAPNP